MLAPIKVAVTGASGFLGRHVLNELAKHDIRVIAVTRDESKLAGLTHAVEVVEFDLSDTGRSVYSNLGEPDILLHLAWNGLPNYNSLHHFETELSLQYRFLENMVAQGLKSLSVTGTCFEYGMQSGVLSEDMETSPTNSYGFAKDSLRKQLMFLKTRQNFSFTWARLFYLFGNGQSEVSLWSQLQKACDSNQSVFNMSAGEQIRDFLSVAEAVRLLVLLTLKSSDCGIVNVCSGIPRSVRSLVESWVRERESDVKLNLGYYPYPSYEPFAFWGCTKKLNSLSDAS